MASLVSALDVSKDRQTDRPSHEVILGLYAGSAVLGWLLSLVIALRNLRWSATGWITKQSLLGPFGLGFEQDLLFTGIVLAFFGAVFLGLVVRRTVTTLMGCFMVFLWTLHGLFAVGMGV